MASCRLRPWAINRGTARTTAAMPSAIWFSTIAWKVAWAFRPGMRKRRFLWKTSACAMRTSSAWASQAWGSGAWLGS